MDIDLLSKMVKELILDNERVVLPGLGSFVAEIVPATFSDKGYTINPPYRKLYFRSKPDEGSDLIPFYAKSNSVSEEIAEKVIVDFVTDLKSVLFQKKTVIFPGLGRLRATKENNVFFVADEDLDIYPEGFGLEPISLKTHTASAGEVKAVVSDLKSILTESVAEVPVEDPVVEVPVEDPVVEVPVENPVAEVPVEEPVAEVPVEDPVVEVPVEDPVVEEIVVAEEVSVEEPEELPLVDMEEELPMAELVEEPEEILPEVIMPQVILPEVTETVAEKSEEKTEEKSEEKTEGKTEEKTEEKPVVPVKKNSFWKVLLKTLIWMVVIAAVLLGAYVAVGHFCPEWLDQFLYTPEELEILNYR